MNVIRNQVLAMLKKVALKTVALNEGAILLNDLEKQTKNKDELYLEFCDIYRTLPQETHAKTFLQIIALTDNPCFETVLILGLEHADENVARMSLEGLARYKDDAAKAALIKQLAHFLPIIRKTAGEMIIKRWRVSGVKILLEHGVCHEDKAVVNTACAVLTEYGVVIVPVVIDAMRSMNDQSLLTSAKLLVGLNESVDIRDHINKEHMTTLIRVLERVSGNKDPNCIIVFLELVGVLKDRLAGYEDTIAAYLRVEHTTIKLVAHKILSSINTDRAREILAAVQISLGKGGYIVSQLPTPKEERR